MNGDFDIDVQEVLKAVDSAEVISFFFPMLGKSLVIDMRFDVENEPLVRLMPQAGSLQERYRSIRRLRPQFPRPQSIAAIPWYRYVRSFHQLGILDRLRSRLVQSGLPRPVEVLNEAVEELKRLEKRELASAIRGDSYQTIWPLEK